MRNNYRQMSLFDAYRNVEIHLETDKPEFFRLLEEHLDWDEIIPESFNRAFYLHYGRNRKYSLEGFIRALLLQRLFHYVEDSQLLNTLRYSREMRLYCGFDKIPDASKLTRFKQNFCVHIRDVFDCLVELTEPICRRMDETLADMLTFDTTGIESYVAENNPKFPRTKSGTAYEYSGTAAVNPAVKHQYINGHLCYAQKAAVLSNGLGIVRYLELFDEDFKKSHPEMPIEKRTKHPEIDKEIGDSTALKPVLLDLRVKHPNLKYRTFSADAAFDSYDNFRFLLKDYGFGRAVIPINPRNSKTAAESGFNESGTPLCPKDGTPLHTDGSCAGKKRSPRLKFVCPKSARRGTTFVCQCDNPCVSSKGGRCVYVYPDKNLRLYPGIAREDEKFAKIYTRRTAVERSINTLKDTLGLSNRKTSNVLTTKADLFLAGITQLLCVLLADKLHKPMLARRPRKLIA